jgi:hypothetical protein
MRSLVKKNEGPEIKEKKMKERKQWIEKYLDMTENSKLGKYLQFPKRKVA